MNTDNNGLYVITGATDTMGRVISRRLAAQGKPIVMACFNVEKSREFARQLVDSTGNTDITTLHLDLGSFASVKSFVRELESLGRPVRTLINNASYISHHSEKSPDGYEKLVQVNFLSTVLLSQLCQKLMGEGSGIIFTTSLTRNLVSLPYEFPAVNNFMPIAAFAQSKLALTLFAIYMSTVLRSRHINVNCVDAGIINLSMARVNRWFEKFDILITRRDKTEVGARTMMRAIESNDTGFIFKGQDRQMKITQLLKNREVFAKLCTDTMRVMKKHLE